MIDQEEQNLEQVEAVLEQDAAQNSEQLEADPAQSNTQQTENSKLVETPAARNFRALEAKAKRLERERDEALRKLDSKTEATEQKIEEIEEDIALREDDLVEGKHLKKMYATLRQLKQEVKKYKQESAMMSEEVAVKTQYPDIEKVVTAENLQLLREYDPDFAAVLDSSNNFKAKAAAAYKHIKKLGIYTDEKEQEAALAQKNLAKPRPLTSVSAQKGDSPLTRANAFAGGLTDDLKAQLLREMTEAMKNY